MYACVKSPLAYDFERIVWLSLPRDPLRATASWRLSFASSPSSRLSFPRTRSYHQVNNVADAVVVDAGNGRSDQEPKRLPAGGVLDAGGEHVGAELVEVGKSGKSHSPETRPGGFFSWA